MKSVELKITRIGNSRGVRLPAESLRRYRMGGVVIMEEKIEGILLRPVGSAAEKLSWEETAREMAANREDWDDWNAVAGDGLDSVPWAADRSRRVAERRASYHAKSQSAGKPA